MQASQVILPGPYRLTYVDWLKLPDGSRHEIIEGDLYMVPPPSITHQRISREIEHRLFAFLNQAARGEVLYAPVGVKISDETVLEPDLVVVLAAHADRIGTHAIEGTPDLVVEILSPGSAGRDLGRKRELYQGAGVPEYWIVDPETQSIEVLGLERGRYARRGLYRIGDTLRSPLLEGLELPLAEVFPR